MTSAIQFIPTQGRPTHLRTISEIEGMLTVRIAEEFLKKRKGDNGKDYTYVPWEKTLEVLNKIFGPFGWGSNDPLSFYVEDGRTFVVVKSLTIAGYDEGAGGVWLVTKTNTGRAVSSENARANDTAAAAADSDALSRVAKLLGDALGAFLYDPADPAHSNPTTSGSGQSGNTWATGRGGAQATQQATRNGNTSSGKRAPTDNQKAAMRRYEVPDSLINRATFDQASRFIGEMKNGASVDQALGSAGLIEYSGIAAEPGLDDVEEIPF